jgi:hypothetical protein
MLAGCLKKVCHKEELKTYLSDRKIKKNVANPMNLPKRNWLIGMSRLQVAFQLGF